MNAASIRPVVLGIIITAAALCLLLVFPCAVPMLFHTKTPHYRCCPSHYDPQAS